MSDTIIFSFYSLGFDLLQLLHTFITNTTLKLFGVT